MKICIVYLGAEVLRIRQWEKWNVVLDFTGSLALHGKESHYRYMNLRQKESIISHSVSKGVRLAP